MAQGRTARVGGNEKGTKSRGRKEPTSQPHHQHMHHHQQQHSIRIPVRLWRAIIGLVLFGPQLFLLLKLTPKLLSFNFSGSRTDALTPAWNASAPAPAAPVPPANAGAAESRGAAAAAAAPTATTAASSVASTSREAALVTAATQSLASSSLPGLESKDASAVAPVSSDNRFPGALAPVTSKAAALPLQKLPTLGGKNRIEGLQQRQRTSKEGERVAICLAGSLRRFELTAYSLAAHLFLAYPSPDVFVFAPVDETSHKVVLLLKAAQQGGGSAGAATWNATWTLRGIKFLPQEPLDEAYPGAQILLAHGSPNGVQGLLQYFQLVEGCLELITAAEQAQGYPYDWVIRTRPDSFWAGPAPGLAELSPTAYSYPGGTTWNGLNDRFGAARGPRGKAALRRLSVLKALGATQKKGGSNSERCLKRHMEHINLPFKPLSIPFCTVTEKLYPWPITPWGLPILGLNSTAPLNGAKCRPCHPALTGLEAFKALMVLTPGRGLPFELPAAHTTGYNLCKATRPWQRDWPQLFDAQAGPGPAWMRKLFVRMTEAQCTADLSLLLNSVSNYSGPPAPVLCSIRTSGGALQGLLKKRGFVPAVMNALELAGRAQPIVVKTFPPLDSWDEETLPLPPEAVFKSCNPCYLLLRVQGSRLSLLKKSTLVAKMKGHGWEVLKCTGMFENQVCMFIHLSAQG